MASGRLDFTIARRADFLDALRHGACVREACRIVKLHHSTLYELRKSDPEFAAEWDAAFDEGFGVYEDAARETLPRLVALASGAPVDVQFIDDAGNVQKAKGTVAVAEQIDAAEVLHKCAAQRAALQIKVQHTLTVDEHAELERQLLDAILAAVPQEYREHVLRAVQGAATSGG
jgi:hypothetical protein